MPSSKIEIAFWLGVMASLDKPSTKELSLIESILPELIETIMQFEAKALRKQSK